MLDRRLLKTKVKPTWHRSFLPQEVVRHEVWTKGFQKRPNYRQQSPQRKMQSTTHPNQWVQYTFQPQSVVQSQKDQDEARTSIILNQL